MIHVGDAFLDSGFRRNDESDAESVMIVTLTHPLENGHHEEWSCRAEFGDIITRRHPGLDPGSSEQMIHVGDAFLDSDFRRNDDSDGDKVKILPNPQHERTDSLALVGF